MTSITDHHVTPHQLCFFCKKFLQQNNDFNIVLDENNTWGRVGTRTSNRASELYTSRFEHYTDLRSLFQSAREGACHLCSIIVDHIFAYYGDDQTEHITRRLNSPDPKQLHVLAYGGAYQPQHGCTRFHVHVWEDPVGEGEALSVTQVHRHLKDQSSISGKCSSLLERESDFPKEANYRWSMSTGSDEAFELIRRWLDNCLSSHKECNNNANAMRPTRLLDVEVLGTKDIRLIHGDSTKGEPYATLSYCWGPIKPIILERSNYQDFAYRIPWDRLPKTMQDAAIVCRKLQIRYLWIDALCIIQGIDGDFETEASRMESVYAGSLFTIAAADSEDSNGGCFQDRVPLMREDLRVTEDAEQITFVQARPSCKFYGNLPGHCVLDTRGWVFQERLLSPRTLYFGQRGLHMECRNSLVCEYNPDSHGDENQYRKVEPLKKTYSTLRYLGEGGTGEEALQTFQQLWTNVLKGYTRTALSHPADRLSALAGIASLVKGSLSIDSSFGLWLPIFLDELLWKVLPKHGDQSRHTHGFEFIPSWSWTNMNASVENAQEETKTTNKLEVLAILFAARMESLPPATSFIQLPALQARFARPVSIRLCGKLTKCWAQPYHPEFGPISYDLHPEEDGLRADRKRCAFHPDLPMKEDTTGLYCFLVKREHRRKLASEQQMTSLWDFGIVLKPTGSNNPPTFRRFGLYHEKMIDSMCNWRHQATIRERVARYGQDEMDTIEHMKLYMIMFPVHGLEVEVEII